MYKKTTDVSALTDLYKTSVPKKSFKTLLAEAIPPGSMADNPENNNDEYFRKHAEKAGVKPLLKNRGILDPAQQNRLRGIDRATENRLPANASLKEKVKILIRNPGDYSEDILADQLIELIASELNTGNTLAP